MTRMELARRPRIVQSMVRRTRLRTLIAGLLSVMVMGCAVGDTPPPAGVRPDGFPTGVFARSFDDPFFGPIRVSWVFDADGDWAEIMEATQGQTLHNTGPSRGHYTVDGDLLSITVDAPSFFVDHTHRWRFEGDRLITSDGRSENPDDIEWFAMLDRQPWVRVP
jgi:hypothetical protein